MKSLHVVSLLLFVLLAVAPVHAATENAVVETKLPNGLTVLTKEVHTAPVVKVMVTYKVGARNENIGQTGMSHLLEHMMFKGTKKLKPGEIDRIFDLVGADHNAFTSEDMTAYHSTLAAEHLETALRIESDRMVNSLFDPEQHKREMVVVRSELEGNENSPDTLLYHGVVATAFQAHPYRWPIIGWRSDVENVDRDAMYRYYKNWYTPGNAILVIVGDIDTAKTLDLVRSYFGKIPNTPVARHYITPEPPQEGERRYEIQRSGTTARVLLAYRVPRFGHPDYYALDVASTLLSEGRSSRLFQSMVETGIATSAFAYNPDHADPFLIFFGASAQQGKTADDLEKALLAQVERLKKEPVSDAELNRARNQIEASFTFERDSIPDQAQKLSLYAAWGDWRYSEQYLPRIRQVTAADIQRVANRYLVERNRTAGRFVPRAPAPGEPTSESSAPGPVGGPANYRSATPARDQASRNAPEASYPRAAAAAPNTAPSAPAAKTARVVLPNGMVLLIRENHSNPTVSIHGSILAAGGASEPANQSGIAAFTAAMLERGTTKRTSLEIAQQLEDVGAELSISSSMDYAAFSGRALVKDLPRLFDVLSDQLRNPAFSSEQIEKLRAETLSALEQEEEEPALRAARAFAGAVFPPGHPYWQPSPADQKTILESIKRDDLVAFHSGRYAPNVTVLSIVGDVDVRQVTELVQRYFADWKPIEGLKAPTIPPVARQTEGKRIVITMPDKSEVDVVYGFSAGLTRTSPDYYAARILNWTLGGGSFGSRLMADIRDRQGLVYGVYSDIDAGLGAGPFQVTFGANPSNVDTAVKSTRAIIQDLRDKGITEEELDRAKSFITGSYPLRLSTNAGMAGQMLIAEIYNLGLDYPERYASLYRSVTREQVNEAARRYLDPTIGTLVLAGPYPPPASPVNPASKAPEKVQ